MCVADQFTVASHGAPRLKLVPKLLSEYRVIGIAVAKRIRLRANVRLLWLPDYRESLGYESRILFGRSNTEAKAPNLLTGSLSLQRSRKPLLKQSVRRRQFLVLLAKLELLRK